MAYQGDGRLPVIYVRGFAGRGSIPRWRPVLRVQRGLGARRVDGASEPHFCSSKARCCG